MNELKNFARQMWWVYVLQGMATLMLGVVALFWPGLTLVTTLYALAIYAVIVGATDIIFSVSTMKANRSWWVMSLSGIVLIGVAAYLLKNLDVALTTFAILLGLVFVVRGVLEVIGAALGETAGDRILVFITGFLAIVAGLIIWFYPISGSLSFIWVLGLFAIIRGTLDIVNATSLYGDVKDLEDGGKKLK
jgi:uncharacterized membrane protein HdeD (DUF308 family)